MRKFWIPATVAGLMIGGTAVAGAAFDIEVFVGSGVAYGNFDDARNSADAAQYIYCSTSATSTSLSGFCVAVDSASNVASCSTTDANIVSAIQSLSSQSFVIFSYDTTTSQCTNVAAYTGSPFLP